MSEHASPIRPDRHDEPSPFDELMSAAGQKPADVSFATAFRGYDKDEVDAAISALLARVRAETDQVAHLTDRQRRLGAQSVRSRQSVERLEAELAAAKAQADEGTDRLKAELAAAQAKATDAENRLRALGEELTDSPEGGPGRHKFEEVLRVAEDQAGVLLRNATDQGERLLVAAREEVQNRRKEAQAEAEAIVSQAQHDAQQAQLRIDTELTAHQARIEREAAHAAEKVLQAEREAAAIRTEAEKGAAALRSMVARETEHARAEAEDAVRELRVRAMDFEASLTRRQDDAQQEFLVLHNQAVAHAERITQDANEQVAASLAHAQRVASKAEDFERLMRAQAQQIEADANIRAHEQLDRARDKAQKIMDMVTSHSHSVLRDAEDRTRQLRWQQQQLTSFMSEVADLMRPASVVAAAESGVDAGEATDRERAAAPAADSEEEPDAESDAEPAAEPEASEPEENEHEQEFERVEG